MKRNWLWASLLLATVCLTSTPVAATTLQWAGGSYGNTYGGPGVGAYTFHINGDKTKTVLGVCDDAMTYMPAKYDPWNVVVHAITLDTPGGLNNPPPPQARFFSDSDPDASLQKYRQGAWLASRIVSITGNTVASNIERTELQYAMWRLFTPAYNQTFFNNNPAKLTAVNSWIAKSLDAVVHKNFTGAGWSVFTPVYPCGPSTGCDPKVNPAGDDQLSQEIFINTPEASAASLLTLNLLGLLGLARFFRSKIG